MVKQPVLFVKLLSKFQFGLECSTKNHAVKLLPLNRSSLFLLIPSFCVCCVVIFARSLGSPDSRISCVRSFKTKLARASFERDYNVCSPYFKLQGSPNRILFFAVFSLSGSSTSDVECDNRG